MSTYLYLKCLDHDPPLLSYDEVGQHLYDLPRIRKDIADRELFIAHANSDRCVKYEYFTGNAARFLVDHPRCRIGIQDEYRRDHPIDESDGTR